MREHVYPNIDFTPSELHTKGGNRLEEIPMNIHYYTERSLTKWAMTQD